MHFECLAVNLEIEWIISSKFSSQEIITFGTSSTSYSRIPFGNCFVNFSSNVFENCPLTPLENSSVGG